MQEEDVDFLSQWKWCVFKKKFTSYAVRRC